MPIFDFENLFANGAFATLFITTFFYWVMLGFFPISKSAQMSLEVNGRSDCDEVLNSAKKTISDWRFQIGNMGLIFANIQLLLFFVLRWIDSHHFPLSNLYESLLFLSWSLTLGHFFVPANVGAEFMIGAITAPSALFVNAFASLSLPANLKAAAPLIPALQSNWLMMHVTMMIVSYSMLILGSLFSIALLIFSFGIQNVEYKTKQEETPQNTLTQTTPTTLTQTTALLELSESKLESEHKLLKVLDNLSYRTLGFGFPLLTIGILSGAVWANQAWGSYWSWDPKETWALITWVIFAIYFHFRFNKKWSGKKPAIVATIGFIFLWVCYLGVNLLGKGLHSYGWFS